MKKYRVSYYFGFSTPNPHVRPLFKEVEVEDIVSENEVILKGLEQFMSYPVTYYATVEELQ